jgi:S1-C subfamily serine protease
MKYAGFWILLSGIALMMTPYSSIGRAENPLPKEDSEASDSEGKKEELIENLLIEADLLESGVDVGLAGSGIKDEQNEILNGKSNLILKSRECLMRASALGCTKAMVWLGKNFKNPKFKEYVQWSNQQNIKESMDWFQKAWDHGRADGGYELAMMLIFEETQATKGEDYKKAYDILEILVRKTELKPPRSLLGVMYLKGLFLEKDISRALKYAEEGYDDNNEFSIAVLAEVRNSIDGSFENEKQAFALNKRLALRGSPEHMVHLGLSYLLGHGIERNIPEGLKWLVAVKSFGTQETIPRYETYKEMMGNWEKNMSIREWEEIEAKARNLVKDIKDNKRVDNSAKVITDKEKARTGKINTEGNVAKQYGTGVIISNDGVIVTAAHVVAGCQAIDICTNGKKVEGYVLMVNEDNDIALLKAKDGEYVPVPVKTNTQQELGSRVFTVGYPHIDIQGLSPKMTRGEISSKNGMADDPRCWQISVPIQKGNSGGGLFDENGNLIGIIVRKMDSVTSALEIGDSMQNVNYAVKAQYLTPLLQEKAVKLPVPHNSRLFTSDEEIVKKVTKSTVLIFGR